MAIKINGTTVINDSRELENVAAIKSTSIKVDTGNVDTNNAGGSIAYTVPAEGTSNANGAQSGGLYVRAGSTWYYRLGASGFGRTSAWSGTNTLVCSASNSSGTSVTSALAGVQDGDYLQVFFTSTRYGLFQVNDQSIFSSSNGYFFDVDHVSSAGGHGNTTGEAVTLKYDFDPITATVSGLNSQASTLTINPITWVNFNGNGSVAARDSQNVSSLTDNSTGNYTVNFANTMSNSNYSVSFSATDDGSGSSQTNGYAYGSWLRGSTAVSYSTTSIRVGMGYPANTAFYDQSHVNVNVVGDG